LWIFVDPGRHPAAGLRRHHFQQPTPLSPTRPITSEPGSGTTGGSGVGSNGGYSSGMSVPSIESGGFRGLPGIVGGEGVVGDSEIGGIGPSGGDTSGDFGIEGGILLPGQPGQKKANPFVGVTEANAVVAIAIRSQRFRPGTRMLGFS